MAIEDTQSDQLFQSATKALEQCSPAERAMLGFVGAMLSEMRTMRKIQEEQAQLTKARSANALVLGAAA